MLDARKLRMLAELERLGTVAEVARVLHLTGPGVSMQIAALEREVGLALTERNGRKLALTPAGKLLASHGHDITDRLSLAQVEVAALLSGAAGTYRLASFASAARTVVAAAWKRLRAQGDGAGLKLEVLEMEVPVALTALAGGEVDLAIVHAYSNMPKLEAKGLVATQIASEPVFMVVPRGAVPEGEAVDLRDFTTHEWVIPAHTSSCYDMIQRSCGVAGFAPRAVVEACDFATILAFIAAGVGVGLVPRFGIASLPEGVTVHPLVKPVFRHDFVANRQTIDADPGVHRVRQLLADAAKDLGVAPVSDKRRRS